SNDCLCLLASCNQTPKKKELLCFQKSRTKEGKKDKQPWCHLCRRTSPEPEFSLTHACTHTHTNKHTHTHSKKETQRWCHLCRRTSPEPECSLTHACTHTHTHKHTHTHMPVLEETK